MVPGPALYLDLSKARRKPYGHVGYTRHTKTGKLVVVDPRGVKPAEEEEGPAKRHRSRPVVHGGMLHQEMIPDSGVAVRPHPSDPPENPFSKRQKAKFDLFEAFARLWRKLGVRPDVGDVWHSGDAFLQGGMEDGGWELLARAGVIPEGANVAFGWDNSATFSANLKRLLEARVEEYYGDRVSIKTIFHEKQPDSVGVCKWTGEIRIAPYAYNALKSLMGRAVYNGIQKTNPYESGSELHTVYAAYLEHIGKEWFKNDPRVDEIFNVSRFANSDVGIKAIETVAPHTEEIEANEKIDRYNYRQLIAEEALKQFVKDGHVGQLGVGNYVVAASSAPETVLHEVLHATGPHKDYRDKNAFRDYYAGSETGRTLQEGAVELTAQIDSYYFWKSLGLNVNPTVFSDESGKFYIRNHGYVSEVDIVAALVALADGATDDKVAPNTKRRREILADLTWRWQPDQRLTKLCELMLRSHGENPVKETVDYLRAVINVAIDVDDASPADVLGRALDALGEIAKEKDASKLATKTRALAESARKKSGIEHLVSMLSFYAITKSSGGKKWKTYLDPLYSYADSEETLFTDAFWKGTAERQSIHPFIMLTRDFLPQEIRTVDDPSARARRARVACILRHHLGESYRKGSNFRAAFLALAEDAPKLYDASVADLDAEMAKRGIKLPKPESDDYWRL